MRCRIAFSKQHPLLITCHFETKCSRLSLFKSLRYILLPAGNDRIWHKRTKRSSWLEALTLETTAPCCEGLGHQGLGTACQPQKSYKIILSMLLHKNAMLERSPHNQSAAEPWLSSNGLATADPLQHCVVAATWATVVFMVETRHYKCHPSTDIGAHPPTWSMVPARRRAFGFGCLCST